MFSDGTATTLVQSNTVQPVRSIGTQEETMNPQSTSMRTTVGRTTAVLVIALLVVLSLAAIAIAGSSKGQSALVILRHSTLIQPELGAAMKIQPKSRGGFRARRRARQLFRPELRTSSA